MSVIIRLQNLPWSANALDIRQYFNGLNIPEGGVNIVGGELGDAFIAFSTDEDARQAFQRNNGKIKEVQISLMLSSRTEMQRVIEQARSQSYTAFMGQSSQVQPVAVPIPTAVPGIIPSSSSSDAREKDRSSGERRDRKRSRSRDRRDRSRDRKDRRYRSRSRSRDRRRRRGRSRSRSRTRSRDRNNRSKEDRRRSDDLRSSAGYSTKPQPKIDPWVQSDATAAQLQQPNLLANIAALGNLGVINPLLNATSLQAANVLASAASNRTNPNRESWPPAQGKMLPQNNITSPKSTNGNFINSKDPRSFKINKDDDESQFDRNNPRGVYGTNYNSKNNHNGEKQIDKGRDPRFTPNCCIKMEPFYGAYGDVRRFFQGNFISSKGIKFINDKFGTRTGIVFVQFATMQGKVNALAKNNQSLNGVTVSIAHIEDVEFDNAVDRFLPCYEDQDAKPTRTYHSKYAIVNKPEKPEEMITNFTSLTVEDLPTYVKEQDILKMFSVFSLTSLILTSKGKNGHIAYVKFSTEEEAKKAFAEKSLHSIEGKPVTVKPCKDSDFEAINKQHDVDFTPSNQKVLETDCLSISGLPLKTSDRDIADFFSDIGITPSKIHLMNSNVGFTGQAYCEFRSETEATKGMKKDGSTLGSNVVSVSSISRTEMEPIVQVKMDDDTDVPENNEISEEVEGPKKPYYSSFRGKPFMPQFRPHMGNRPPFMRFDGPMRGRGGFMGSRGRGGPHMRFTPPNYEYNGEYEEEQINGVALGCTVYMNNIPYKAGTNEILDFFEGYNVSDNVSRRYNANNTPTAEARVTFSNPEEASRAVQELNSKKIWDRPIYLKQV